MKTRYNTRLTGFRNGLLLCLIFIGFALHAETKYAVIVGIGHQPTDTKWKNTTGDKDAVVMRDLLKKQGFDSLILLTNEQATKSNVTGALNQAIKSLQAGDIFVFHYAGHGQQIEDDNNEDIDGLDEALALYGAPSRYDNWYRFENHLRDDEFSEIIDRMRAKLGDRGEVLIITDAGFGTENSTGSDSIRGGAKAFVPAEFSQAGRYMDISAGIYEDRPFGMPANSVAPIVTISASLTHQVACEFGGNGALTRAFERAMEKYTVKTTYEDLFNLIVANFKEMNLTQFPVMEGFYDMRAFRNATVSAMSMDWNSFTDNQADLKILQNLSNRVNNTHLLQQMEIEPRLKALF